MLHAVIARESASAYQVKAVSPVGAKGLMQLMPTTAKSLGVSADDIFGPYQNIHTGARYLKQQLADFNGRLDWALAACNAGTSTVKRYRGILP